MRNVQAFVAALVAMLLAFAAPSVARADINGSWQSDLGVFSLQLPPGAGPNRSVQLETTVSPSPPTNGQTTLGGEFRNLVWKGRWRYHGAPPFPRCPGGDSGLRSNAFYGSFMVTFNADETSFTGVMTNCDVPLTDRTRSRPFNGTRRNTITDSVPPTTPAPTGGLTSTRGGEGPLEPIDVTPLAFDPCYPSNRPPVPFSTAFATRPCYVSVGQVLQIDALVNGSQRPTTMIAKGFVRVSRGREPIRIGWTGQTFRLGLPNRGVPTVSTPFRVTLPGGVCRDDFWLVYLLMSDGTETPAIGVLNSGCGPTARMR
ncbi:MAG: hypothetical protein KBA31_19780 [Alphaproteobacteria bacterium]|nr:hypothetical protein [Alphaproteobacteria bacterium]